MHGSRPITQPWQVQLVCAAIIFANFVYLLAAVVLHLSGALPGDSHRMFAGEQAQVFTYAVLAGGFTILAVSFAVRTVLRRQLTVPASLRRIATACIIPCALADGVGVLGLIVVLLQANWPIAGLLWAIGIGAGILHYPTSAWLDSLRDH